MALADEMALAVENIKGACDIADMMYRLIQSQYYALVLKGVPVRPFDETGSVKRYFDMIREMYGIKKEDNR